MSGGDVPNTDHILQDLSRFPTLADRLQQGDGQLPAAGPRDDPPGGASPPIRRSRTPARPLIDTRRLYYSGGSQGGISGGALTAVAPDFTRSVLIVPAMNYSLLLTRSIDFDPFAAVLYPVLSGRARAPAAAVADPDALGSRRAQRLRVAHDRRSVPQHAGAHGAACTWPSETTRWPTWRPRSRRAPSARASGCPALDPGRSTDVRALLRHRADPQVPRTAAARSWSGTSGRCGRPAVTLPARRAARARAAADHQHAAAAGTRPARPDRPRARRAAAVRGVHRRRVRRRLRSAPCYAAGWTGP